MLFSWLRPSAIAIRSAIFSNLPISSKECASLSCWKRCTLFFLKISIHSLGDLWYFTLSSTILLFCIIKFASRSISFGSRENDGSGAIWPITSTFGFSIAFSNAWSHTCLLWYLVWKLAIKKYLSAYFSGQSKEPSIRIFASKSAIISMICLLLIICCISSRYLGIQSDVFLTCSAKAIKLQAHIFCIFDYIWNRKIKTRVIIIVTMDR